MMPPLSNPKLRSQPETLWINPWNVTFKSWEWWESYFNCSGKDPNMKHQPGLDNNIGFLTRTPVGSEPLGWSPSLGVGLLQGGHRKAGASYLAWLEVKKNTHP